MHFRITAMTLTIVEMVSLFGSPIANNFDVDGTSVCVCSSQSHTLLCGYVAQMLLTRQCDVSGRTACTSVMMYA